MRILYVTFDDLGTEFAWAVHVKAVVNGLVRLGHRVRVVAPGKEAPADLDGEFVGMVRGRTRARRALQHLVGSLGTIVRAGRGFRPDILYCRGIHLSPTPPTAARILGCPYVVEVNGLLEAELNGWLRGPVRVAHRFILAASARAVTVSERLRGALCRLYGADADKVIVIPNGADPGRFRPESASTARKRLQLPDGPTLVYTGSFYPHHALDLLPEILARTPQCRALLVGDGVTRGGLETALDPERVTFAGRVPHRDVPGYVSSGDVGLYLLRRPHPRFGFSPIKLFEYMAAARPVLVGTDLPEIREFVRKHRIGEASDLDPGRIAAAAERLLRDADARRRMGENGRRLVEEQFNWDRSVADLEKVLMSCASR